jgi:hypothetical protein
MYAAWGKYGMGHGHVEIRHTASAGGGGRHNRGESERKRPCLCFFSEMRSPCPCFWLLAFEFRAEQPGDQPGHRPEILATVRLLGPMGPKTGWRWSRGPQGAQLGHRATWFGGGRARPALGLAPLSPPRTLGWLLLGDEASRISANWAWPLEGLRI